MTRRPQNEQGNTRERATVDGGRGRLRPREKLRTFVLWNPPPTTATPFIPLYIPYHTTKMAGTKRSSPGAEAAKEVEVELSEEQVKVLDDFSKELKRAELILGIFPFRPISYDVC